MLRGALLLGVAAFGLAACERASEADSIATNGIDCALGGAAGFAPDCTMERAEREGQKLLIIRHPDGGFRRFRLGVPGEGLIEADGMEPAEVLPGDNGVEVRVGADRYRLPIGG